MDKQIDVTCPYCKHKFPFFYMGEVENQPGNPLEDQIFGQALNDIKNWGQVQSFVSGLILGLTLGSLPLWTGLPYGAGMDSLVVGRQTSDFPELLPLARGSHDRQTPTQDEWRIAWDGTPDKPFYVTYGVVATTAGVDHEESASAEGNQLPQSLTFFLESGPTITATLNLDATGTASAQLFKNGTLCDSASQTGTEPAIRVTCFPK